MKELTESTGVRLYHHHAVSSMSCNNIMLRIKIWPTVTAWEAYHFHETLVRLASVIPIASIRKKVNGPAWGTIKAEAGSSLC